MQLIDTWCLRGQMNQIWLGLIWIYSSDQILERTQQKNKNNNHQKTPRNVLGDILWDGGRGKGSPMHCSPPARWGLLDFMSVACLPHPAFRLLPPPASSCLLLLVLVLLLNCDPRWQCSLPSTTTIHAQCSLPDLNHDHPRPVFPAGPQPRPSTPSVPCRTSTTTIHAQCSLPDLNREYPRPVFPAGPQSRVSTPSVPCRTSCRKIWDKECAEES